MNDKLENLLSIPKEELIERMKETYLKTKLPKNKAMVARGIEIFIGLVFLLLDIEWYYKVIYILAVVFGIYKFLHNDAEDKTFFEKFELLAEELENFKKYKKGTLDIKINEKKVSKIEKTILKCLPFLIEFGKTGKMYRVLAFIPILNLRVDELTLYRDKEGGPLNILLYGNLLYTGLEDFSNEKIKNN